MKRLKSMAPIRIFSDAFYGQLQGLLQAAKEVGATVKIIEPRVDCV